MSVDILEGEDGEDGRGAVQHRDLLNQTPILRSGPAYGADSLFKLEALF